MSRKTDLSRQVAVSRRFAAPPSQLFDAWLDPRTAGAWLFAMPGDVLKHIEIDARAGGTFAIHQQRGQTLAAHFGSYLELVRPGRLVFTFGTGQPSTSALVTVDIQPNGAGSLLTLTHELDPEWVPLEAGIRAGWASILDGLARATGEAGAFHTLILHRNFDAPRTLVWKAWTEGEHLMRWLCPAGFKVLFAQNDLRVGGKWRSGMRSPEGNEHIHCGEYLEIEKPARLVFTHTWERNDLEPRAITTITVVLNEQDSKTSMIFIQSGLATTESALSHQRGWTGAFDNLARLASELSRAGHLAEGETPEHLEPRKR